MQPQQQWDALTGAVVRVEQTVPAPPAEVCAAWLDPARLAGWWWPHLADTTYEVEAREGGRFRFHSESAGFGASGTYLYLGPEDAPEIWMTWNWEGGEGSDESAGAPEELVRVRFEAREDSGTDVIVEHRLASPDLDPTNPAQGWTDTVARLA